MTATAPSSAAPLFGRPRRPPAPPPPRPLVFPSFERHRVRSGLTVLAARRGRLPLVRLDLLCPAGAVYDPPGKSGLATLTATLLDEGERGETATERAEQLGGALHCGATWNTANVNVMLHSAHLEAAAGLLAQTLLDCTFPPDQIDRLKRQRLANLLQQRAVARFAAERCFASALYGTGVYGQSQYGDPASVSALGRDDFLSFYRRHYSPAAATLVVVGDVDVDDVLRRAEDLFADGSHQAVPLPDLTPRLHGLEIHVVDFPHAHQVELRVGLPTISFRHPDWVPLELACSLLGGTLISRLNRALREKLGTTYGVTALLEPRLGSVPFVASASVGTESAGVAVDRILFEIGRLGEEPAAPGELEDARSHLRGRMTHRLQSIEGLLNQLSLLAVHDLPADFYDRLPAAIEEAAPQDVQRVARQHLDPRRLAVVAVGPRSVIVPQLERHGQVHVWPADAVISSSQTRRLPWKPS